MWMPGVERPILGTSLRGGYPIGSRPAVEAIGSASRRWGGVRRRRARRSARKSEGGSPTPGSRLCVQGSLCWSSSGDETLAARESHCRAAGFDLALGLHGDLLFFGLVRFAVTISLDVVLAAREPHCRAACLDLALGLHLGPPFFLVRRSPMDRARPMPGAKPRVLRSLAAGGYPIGSRAAVEAIGSDSCSGLGMRDHEERRRPS